MNESRKGLICFAHIERAGGSSLHRWLHQAVGPYRVIQPRSFWTNEALSGVGPRELKLILRLSPGLRGIGGHSLHPWVDFDSIGPRDIEWITFLREPAARLVSHLNHQRLHMGIPWTLDSFLAEPRFHNFQTVRLGGKASVEAAKEVLETRFAFVGVADRYEESVTRLAEVLSAKDIPTPAVSNDSPQGSPGVLRLNELNQRDRDRIERVIGLDRELYDWVLARFTENSRVETRPASKLNNPSLLRSLSVRLAQRTWSATVESFAHWRWGAASEELRDKFLCSSYWVDRREAGAAIDPQLPKVNAS